MVSSFLMLAVMLAVVAAVVVVGYGIRFWYRWDPLDFLDCDWAPLGTTKPAENARRTVSDAPTGFRSC